VKHAGCFFAEQLRFCLATKSIPVASKTFSETFNDFFNNLLTEGFTEDLGSFVYCWFN